MNGKHDRMKLVARQSQLLSSITELAVSLRRPPQDVVPALFKRLEVSSTTTPFPLEILMDGAGESDPFPREVDGVFFFFFP